MVLSRLGHRFYNLKTTGFFRLPTCDLLQLRQFARWFQAFIQRLALLDLFVVLPGVALARLFHERGVHYRALLRQQTSFGELAVKRNKPLSRSIRLRQLQGSGVWLGWSSRWLLRSGGRIRQSAGNYAAAANPSNHRP